MVNCPACGSEVGNDLRVCPRCHLPDTLFDAVREAAGDPSVHPPAYLRTIGELLATVDREPLPESTPGPSAGALSRLGRFPSLPAGELPVATPPPAPSVVPALRDLPLLPAGASYAETRRRLDEYFVLGRRLGLDFTDFEARYGAASLSDDLDSMGVLVHEMFVHLASAISEEFESALARRNELAQLVATSSADVELDGIRRAVAAGDLTGARRRLVHVRDELARAEEKWEVGRILVTECDLLSETLRELGGDPAPALGLVEEGRTCFRDGREAEGERLVAQAAIALWALLEPRFLDDLKRLRDRMVESRSAGVDIAPALRSLREVAAELRQRNFAGTVVAYRTLRRHLERVAGPEPVAPAELVPVGRADPSPE